MSALFSVDLLPWIYALGLLIIGFSLVLLEIFVIPGFNIFGMLGVATICVGIAFAYLRMGVEAAVVVGTLGILGTVALVWLLIRNRAWQRLVLESETDKASGYHAGPTGTALPRGEVGVALTSLRPAGRARFGEKVVDVVTEGGFIDPGAAVEVVAVHGIRVVVQVQKTE